jgi:hypothetical protein
MLFSGMVNLHDDAERSTASRVLHAGIQMALIAVSQGDSKPARLASGPEFAFEAFKVTQGNLGFLAKRRTARRVPEMKA